MESFDVFIRKKHQVCSFFLRLIQSIKSFYCRRWCYYYGWRCWFNERPSSTDYCCGNFTTTTYRTDIIHYWFNETNLSSSGINQIRYEIIHRDLKFFLIQLRFFSSLLSDCLTLTIVIFLKNISLLSLITRPIL